MAYDIVEALGDSNQVVDATTKKTFTAPLSGECGFWISVATADIWIRFADQGDAAASTGLRIAAGQQPVFIPIPHTFTAFGSAASCPTSVLWVR